jgi:hypothetical protein
MIFKIALRFLKLRISIQLIGKRDSLNFEYIQLFSVGGNPVQVYFEELIVAQITNCRIYSWFYNIDFSTSPFG